MFLKFFEVQVNRTFVNRLTGWKTRNHVCCYSWEKVLLKLKFWKSTSETFHFCRVKHLYMTDWIAIYAWPQIKHCCEYIDWIFTFTQIVITNYKWCDCSDNFFSFHTYQRRCICQYRANENYRSSKRERKEFLPEHWKKNYVHILCTQITW